MAQSESIGELAKALSKLQSEIRGYKEDSENPFYKSKYGDLTSVWAACRKPLTDAGLSVVQTLTGNGDGSVVIITTLMHNSGEWIRGSLPVKPVKADPQALGSAITYGRRYSLAAIVGIAPEDDDAESAMSRSEEPAQKRERKQSAAKKKADAHPKDTKSKDTPVWLGSLWLKFVEAEGKLEDWKATQKEVGIEDLKKAGKEEQEEFIRLITDGWLQGGGS